MKAALAFGLSLLLAAPAGADELLVGAVRDQDGSVVAGAPVTAVDRSGKALASDRTAADGTFAIATSGHAASLVVAADNADVLRLPVSDPGRPFAAIVQRHRAANLQPDPADIAALPNGSLIGLATVSTYRTAPRQTISDRGLGLGRGVSSIEGLPFYRRSDGADASTLLPSHATGALALQPPIDAVWYGDRAGAGIVDARLFDRSDRERLTNRDGSVLAGTTATEGLAATSWDPDGRRSLVAANGSATFGTASATLVALAGTAPETHYSGFGTELRDATPRLDLDARLGFTNNDGIDTLVYPRGSVTTTATGNNSSLVFDASGRGPNAISVRGRFLDETGALAGGTSEHRDAALVFGTTRGKVALFHAAVAIAYGGDHQYEGANVAGTAVLPSLAFDSPLGGRFSVHAGATSTTLGTPGVAIARGTLGELAFDYADRHRLRAEVEAYVEGDAAPRTVTRGFAASLGWELAPRLSLRTWAFGDGLRTDFTGELYPGAPLVTSPASSTLRRQVLWLTWDAPLRIDLLDREGALEGSLRAPLGPRYAIVISSYRSSSLWPVRVLSIGVTGH